jgi:hypothetical protein
MLILLSFQNYTEVSFNTWNESFFLNCWECFICSLREGFHLGVFFVSFCKSYLSAVVISFEVRTSSAIDQKVSIKRWWWAYNEFEWTISSVAISFVDLHACFSNTIQNIYLTLIWAPNQQLFFWSFTASDPVILCSVTGTLVLITWKKGFLHTPEVINRLPTLYDVHLQLFGHHKEEYLSFCSRTSHILLT